MNVEIKLNNIDELVDAINRAQEKAAELRTLASDIIRLASEIGIEISQPTAGTIG